MTFEPFRQLIGASRILSWSIYVFDWGRLITLPTPSWTGRLCTWEGVNIMQYHLSHHTCTSEWFLKLASTPLNIPLIGNKCCLWIKRLKDTTRTDSKQLPFETLNPNLAPASTHRAFIFLPLFRWAFHACHDCHTLWLDSPILISLSKWWADHPAIIATYCEFSLHWQPLLFKNSLITSQSFLLYPFL